MGRSYFCFTVAALFCCLALSGMATGQAGSGSTHIFYIDTSQHLVQWYNYWNIAAWSATWQDVTAAAGAPPVGAGSGLSSLASNGENLFYVDSSQHVQHLWNNGNSTSWIHADLTALTGCPLANPGSAVASLQVSTGALDVAYEVASTPSNYLGILTRTGSSWVCQTTSLPVIRSETGPGELLQAAAGYGDTYAHFFFVGWSIPKFQAHRYELFDFTYCATCGLLLRSVSPASPKAGIATFADSRGLHVYCEDLNQHIHEQLCPSENGDGVCSGWVDTDLTALTGGTLAAPTSGLTAYNEGSSYANVPGEHVYYLAPNGHVNLLLYTNNAWTNTDISYVAGASQAIPADTHGGLTSTPAFIAPHNTPQYDGAYFLESGNYQIDDIFFFLSAQPPWFVTPLNFEIPNGDMPPTAPDSPLTAFVVQ